MEDRCQVKGCLEEEFRVEELYSETSVIEVAICYKHWQELEDSDDEEEFKELEEEPKEEPKEEYDGCHMFKRLRLNDSFKKMCQSFKDRGEKMDHAIFNFYYWGDYYESRRDPGVCYTMYCHLLDNSYRLSVQSVDELASDIYFMEGLLTQRGEYVIEDLDRAIFLKEEGSDRKACKVDIPQETSWTQGPEIEWVSKRTQNTPYQTQEVKAKAPKEVSFAFGKKLI